MTGEKRRTAGGREAVDFGPLTVFLGAKNGKYPECNQLVVTGSDSRIAIDSSITTHLIGPEYESADLAVLSHGHEDHMAGLYLLPGVPLEVPEHDLAMVQSWEGMVAACGFAPAITAEIRAGFERDFAYHPRPDATGYADGRRWDLGGITMEALLCPGHTAGHSALLFETLGLAFIADIDLTGFGPYYGDAASSLAQFRRSIELVRGIEARIWVTGHHKAIYTDRSRFLADLAAYEAKLDARNARLLARLVASPATLDALTAEGFLYPAGFTAIWLDGVERRVIRRHLEELEAQGEIGFDAASGAYAPR